MADPVTRPTDADVLAFINAIEHDGKRADAFALLDIFREVTGWEPRMWGPTIIGFGAYHYVYDSGHEGDSLATGFSPRKARHSIYILPGYKDFTDILDRLGKRKMAQACLYVNKLADIDLDVLRELIRAGLDNLGTKYPVTAG